MEVARKAGAELCTIKARLGSVKGAPAKSLALTRTEIQETRKCCCNILRVEDVDENARASIERNLAWATMIWCNHHKTCSRSLGEHQTEGLINRGSGESVALLS